MFSHVDSVSLAALVRTVSELNYHFKCCLWQLQCPDLININLPPLLLFELKDKHIHVSIFNDSNNFQWHYQNINGWIRNFRIELKTISKHNLLIEVYLYFCKTCFFIILSKLWTVFNWYYCMLYQMKANAIYINIYSSADTSKKYIYKYMVQL